MLCARMYCLYVRVNTISFYHMCNLLLFIFVVTQHFFHSLFGRRRQHFISVFQKYTFHSILLLI